MRAHRVNSVHILPPFILLALHPMSIEIREESVDVVGTGRISIPFFGIVPKKSLLDEWIGCLMMRKIDRGSSGNKTHVSYIAHRLQMTDEVLCQFVVQVGADKIRASYGHTARQCTRAVLATPRVTHIDHPAHLPRCRASVTTYSSCRKQCRGSCTWNKRRLSAALS